MAEESYEHTVVIDTTTVTVTGSPSGGWSLSVEGEVVDRAAGLPETSLRGALPDGSEVLARVTQTESGSPRMTFSHADHQFAVFNL
ncbi:MAG TPA: hypothetical protein VFJ97_02395 [Dermatophilaceae bacterium]|nr:hypothetical protein [Dermatophilaceae bacterium]